MKKLICLSMFILTLFPYSINAETIEKTENISIKEYSLQIGKIVKSIKLEESIIRYITDKNADEESNYSGYEAQGHIKNISKNVIVDVKIDISFYDKKNKFLGLNELSIFDFDEIDPGMSMPFSIDLDIPENTEICRINIVANKGGLMDKVF